MKHAAIQEVRRCLKESVDEKTRLGAQRFFKEKIQFYGVKVPTVQKIGKQVFKSIQDCPKAKVFALCEPLWQSGMIEEAFIACNWSYAVRAKYEAKDFALFEHWVTTYLDNWATTDSLCNHSIGTLLEMHPKLVTKLKRWAKSENRWVRRAAAVSLILPARKGLFHAEAFKIAEILLCDQDDLVQKGYGWLLKAVADFDRRAVFDFVMQRKDIMPRTALRYAIEKMPPEWRKKAMEKETSTEKAEEM